MLGFSPEQVFVLEHTVDPLARHDLIMIITMQKHLPDAAHSDLSAMMTMTTCAMAGIFFSVSDLIFNT